jgi:hypothetical protein
MPRLSAVLDQPKRKDRKPAAGPSEGTPAAQVGLAAAAAVDDQCRLWICRWGQQERSEALPTCALRRAPHMAQWQSNQQMTAALKPASQGYSNYTSAGRAQVTFPHPWQ